MHQLTGRMALLLAALATLAAPRILVAAGSARPQPVSPGSVAVAELLATTCPTFSWTTVDGASGYELVLYRLAADGALEPRVAVEIPAGAGSWTPPAAQCPRSDSGDGSGRFAWAVRALTDKGPGSWSDVLLFAIPGAPSKDDVRRALEVLTKYEPAASRVPVRRGPSGAEAPDADSSGTEARRYQPDLVATASETVGGDPSPQAVTPPSSFSLNLTGDLDLGGFVFRNGESFIHDLGGNTALGASALTNVQPNFFNQTGLRNSAFGLQALIGTTDGNDNTAVGNRALHANSLGNNNTAVGRRALYSSTITSDNTAVGSLALQDSMSFGNTAVGSEALAQNVVSCCNTAVGSQALEASTGNHNTAIGWNAGENWTTGSDNIAIGSGAYGIAGETDTIRIGGGGLQSRTFIEGIFGQTPPYASVEVFIDGNGQLGAPVSSAKFKQDIRDLEGVGERLLDLRPVSFHYKSDEEASTESERPLEYGLIAEEVARVFPELVINDADGKPVTVRYHLLAPLLLAEIQRLQGEVDRLAALEAQVAELHQERRNVDKAAPRKRWWRK